MALIDHAKSPQRKPKPVEPKIESVEHKSTLIDTRYQSRNNIITQIAGSPWRVDYYSQVLNRDTALNGQSITKDELNQSYICTREFILKVTSPLSTSQDTEVNTFLVTGAANVVPYLKPNQGDMFTADIGEGRLGIFRITGVEQKSYYKESVAAIEYQLVSYADGKTGKVLKEDLEKKTIETRFYVHEFSDYNQNPFVTDDDHKRYRQFKETYPEIVDNYYRLFTSRKYKTLLVPDQIRLTYDPFLVRFMHKAFDVSDTKRSANIKSYNVSEDPVMSLPTIWDALFDRDTDILHYVTTRMVLIPAEYFTSEPIFEGIYYSGLEEVMYPLNPIPDVDGSTPVTKELISRRGPNKSTTTRAINHLDGAPLLPRIHVDEYYVFSQHFYLRSPLMSVLETEVWNYLENKPVNQEAIQALVEDYHNWGNVEKFYYIPVLLLLMHSVIRGL